MIEAVILYSTNDYRFFNTCISNLIKCNIRCHVVTYSHMWNGTIENHDLLDKSMNEFKNHDLVNFYNIEWNANASPWYWEAIGRHLATQEILNNSEYILYIDIDEIIDVDKFSKWIDSKEYTNHDCIKLSGNWYWREPIFQSGPEYNTVMTRTSLAKQLQLVPGGREIYFACSPLQHYTDINNPIIDHYSWVRTKEQMLNKVSNWGHAGDRGDWVSLVEEEFSRPFNGKTFINDYSFKTVENKYNL